MRRSLAISLCFVFALSASIAQAQTITTIAGDSTEGYSGDGLAATDAELSGPHQVAFDSEGNMYIADENNNRIRKVTISTGIISTIAGTATGGFSGDGAAATAAKLSGPGGVAVDDSGNVYISDGYNQRIRKVSASTGFISTIAGTGTASFGGDGAAATAALLNNPAGLALDNSGNLYIADMDNQRIRKITKSTGIITTVAGSGTPGVYNGAYGGDGSAATAARLNIPLGVALDASGNIYIADSDNERIRKVTLSTGKISTVAGSGSGGFSGDSSAATAAKFYRPDGVALDAGGNIYVADWGNNRVRIINNAGIINTYAGSGTAGFSGDGSSSALAELNAPICVATDANGNLYISDLGNNRIRKVSSVLGIAEADHSTTVKLYPNPVSDSFTIETSLIENQLVQIFDSNGKIVFSLIIQQGKTTIGTENLAAGVYTVHYRTANSKLVVIH